MALEKITDGKTGAEAADIIFNNDVDLQFASESKLDKIYSGNLLDPAAFQYDKCYFAGQNPDVATIAGYGMTGYIVANPAGLITTGAGLSAHGLSSYAVFDKNKVWLRNGQNSNTYTYVAGDGFVCFVYENPVTAGFADTKAVCIGSVYAFEEYSDFLPLSDLEARVNTLEEGTTLENVINGAPAIYANVENMGLGNVVAIIERNVEEDFFVFQHIGGGNNWAVSPLFVPLGPNLVHIRGTAEFTKVGTTNGIQFLVAQEPSVGGLYIPVGAPLRDDGTFDITFDPAYFEVYQGYTNFYVWLNNEGYGAGESVDVKITGFRVVEYDGAFIGVNIGGDNAKELFEATDATFSDIKGQLNGETFLVAPNGDKYVLSIDNTGAITSTPVIPTKATFFGNSLIGGFGYGMAASEAQFDYYNRVNTFITALNPTYAYSKEGAPLLEGATTEGELVAAIAAMVAVLEGDETLVSVQLGDNVNTPEKNAIFNGGGCLRALQAIREQCPNARVVWMGMWYGDTDRYNTIINSCKATGSKFITFADLISDATRSFIGAITKKGTDTRTLLNVTSVVANTSTNITVNFTVDGNPYASTLDVTSYSLASTTLTYSGLYEIVSNGGVASHPSDEGFRLIANRFLYQMGLTEDPETYV